MTFINTWRPYLTLCTILLTAVPTITAGAVAQNTYIYREQTGEQQIDYTWNLEQRDGLFVISSIQPEKQFKTVCTADGATLSWTLQKNNGEKMTVRREGNTLHLFGKMDGKAKDQKLAIDDRPWFQPLSFSLRSMATGTKTELYFWTIRPDNFEVVALKAEKKECSVFEKDETIKLACEVEVKKRGWLAPFWHASYWFRKNDGLFVKYRGVHGLPGTSETVIQIIQGQ